MKDFVFELLKSDAFYQFLALALAPLVSMIAMKINTYLKEKLKLQELLITKEREQMALDWLDHLARQGVNYAEEWAKTQPVPANNEAKAKLSQEKEAQAVTHMVSEAQKETNSAPSGLSYSQAMTWVKATLGGIRKEQ